MVVLWLLCCSSAVGQWRLYGGEAAILRWPSGRPSVVLSRFCSGFVVVLRSVRASYGVVLWRMVGLVPLKFPFCLLSRKNSASEGRSFSENKRSRGALQVCWAGCNRIYVL